MPSHSNRISDLHLERLRHHYDTWAAEPSWSKTAYISILGHYYNLLIPVSASVLEVGCGAGGLLQQLLPRKVTGVDISEAQLKMARKRLPHATLIRACGEEFELPDQYDYIILSDTLNYSADVQQLFTNLRKVAHDDTRLIINFHSNLWKPIFDLATQLGWKAREPQSSWLTLGDIENLLNLTDWEPIQSQPRILCPITCGGLERWINRWLAPLLTCFNMVVFMTARRRQLYLDKRESVSVVIPARNEQGNIRAALDRLPQMGDDLEVIFVEGHSKDDTWGEIQRVLTDYPQFKIKAIQQTGKGKGNAVREGFALATGNILMILDADLTMPPEDLPKFYEVICSRRADFANGVRLVYPMEKKAMRFLNLCANKTFSILFTYLLGQATKDTLCGTKVLRREHYERIAKNREYFGDFDPFGDFDLLFGAAKANFRIIDVPIRYQDRTYGETNIQRWKHGWLLLRMVLFAARKLKFV